jgi:hypothetical protein
MNYYWPASEDLRTEYTGDWLFDAAEQSIEGSVIELAAILRSLR